MQRHLLLPAAVLWFGAANAQTQTPPAAPLAFEVASIKPSNLDRPNQIQFRFGPDTVSMAQARLDRLIEQAYEVKFYQVVGGPPWVQSEFYDVMAKAGTAADSHQIRQMLQTLLADRFHLKLHREARTMAGYVLMVDKNGPKLPPARTDVPPDSTGALQMGNGIWARGATIEHLAFGLTLALGQPVIDETKIEGHYDFRLRFEDGDDAASVGSALAAIHEVGLRLEPRKVPVEVLVIDNVDRPSAN